MAESIPPIPSSSDPLRSRKWAPKVKTGCVTCKARRIKCSEERPVCRKCLISGRRCQYVAPPEAWIFESSKSPISPEATLSRGDTNLTVYKTAEEQRALMFFMEKTVPVASTFGDETREFWSSFVPQVSQSQDAVRHMVIALASRHEQVESASEATLSLSHLQPKHYAASLRALNCGRVKLDEEVLLMASTLYIMYGNFEEPEKQTADHLIHLVASVRILTERLSAPGRPPSDIIDTFIRPMLPRLEMMFSNFMMPSSGIEGVVCQVEPKLPDLSKPFADILDARQRFFQLCCWRWRLTARLQPWNRDSAEFRATRKMFLKWYNLMLMYAAEGRNSSPVEQIRVAAIISQFRILFVAVIFSARDDLHDPSHLRSTFVNLLEPDAVSLTYHLPRRWLRSVMNLDWEKRELQDRLGVRLFPITDIAQHSAESGLIRLTYRF